MNLPPAFRIALTGIVALALAACENFPPQRQSQPAPERPRLRPVGDSYSIRSGDLLTITFAGEPDYNQQVRVDWNGRIALPWLAAAGGPTTIDADGMSPAELAAKISKFASDNAVLVNPRAQVFISEYTTQSFVVLGQVNTPGRYMFPRGVPPRLDLEEAIAFGGGYTRLARQSHILVKRGKRVHTVDLRSMTTQPDAERFVVQPGDVITVTERIF